MFSKTEGIKRLYMKFLTILILLVFCFFAEGAVASSKIFGVTIDDPWQQQTEIRDALSSHTVKPFTRIVFDENVNASEYRSAVANIKPVSFIMGEILDSYYVSDYTVQEYLDRTEQYLDEFAESIDIWEIGNEVNGDWLGTIADVKAKIEGAYSLVKSRGLTTALNLYYNKSCYYDKPEYEMFNWINANISEEMKTGLDYVFFSYYEDDCEGVIHTEAEWQEVFDSLHALFPNAKLGFGEIGTEKEEKKAEYMERYYSLDISGSYFVGGYFWWYYKEDCVPKTTALWNTLDTVVTRNYQENNKYPLPPILNLLLLPEQ